MKIKKAESELTVDERLALEEAAAAAAGADPVLTVPDDDGPGDREPKEQQEKV